jgi:hypothetical protein
MDAARSIFGFLPVWGWGLILLLGLLVVIFGWERYRPVPSRPERHLPTTEVFIDPESGRRLRVYVDPASGERSYHQEEASPTLPPLHRPGLWLPAPPPALPPGEEAPPPGGGERGTTSRA